MLFKPRSGLWFSPDTGNATGAGGGTSGGQPPAQPPAQPNSGEPTPPTSPEPTKLITFETEAKLQEHIEIVLKDRLDREKRKAERQTQEAREKAEAEAALKNGEWQKLAEQREAKIGEMKTQITTLESVQEKKDRYEKALKMHLETQRTDLPAHVIELLDKLDPVDQLEYIAKNREALGAQQQPARSGGVPPTPGAGNPGQISAEQQTQARNAQRAQTLRNF